MIIRYDLRLRACGVTVDKPVMIGDDARVRGSCLTMNSTTNLMWCLFVCLSAQEVSTCARWAKLIHSLLFCFSGLHFLFTLRHLHRRLRSNFGIVTMLCMSPKSFAVLRKRKKAVGVMNCKKVLKAAKYDRKTAERVTPMKGMVNDVQAASMMKRPAMKRLLTSVE